MNRLNLKHLANSQMLFTHELFEFSNTLTTMAIATEIAFIAPLPKT